MGVLLAGFSTTAIAQEAELQAALDGIKSKAPNIADLAKTAYKKNKKNADALMKVGRAFFDAKDTANAKVFANYALVASKNKCAPAYILLGDIEALSDNGGAAAAQYDQAVYADPKNYEAYYKYALVYRKIDPQGAARKLDELKANRPDISIEAIKGHIFMLADDRKSAYNEFKKVPVSQIDPDYLNEFARASYFGGHFDDALIACEEGLKHKPGNPAFTRLAMFSNYELKNYDAAKAYLQKYFHELDSVKFSEYDHYYAALIHDKLGDKANAMDSYQKALDLVDEQSFIKRWTILKTMSDSHLKDSEFDKAIQYYQEYLDSKPEVKVDDYEGLAGIYTKYGEADESKKVEMLNKAADVYTLIGEKFPVQQAYASYKRAEMINKTDKDMAGRLAKADYQKVVDLLMDKADRSKSENTMLKYSLHYLMFGSYLDKNIPGAKEYAEKILTIDPEYKPALEIQNLK
jgi:tetratricopeptide (TPR) repeat protein